MYLYVEFANTYAAWIDAEMGFATSSRKRIKRIKLTDEQIRELQPKEVYKNGDTEIYEMVSVLCIQDE